MQYSLLPDLNALILSVVLTQILLFFGILIKPPTFVGV